MNYYKNKTTGVVYAYSEEQLNQVARATELENLLQQQEPVYINASDEYHGSLQGLDLLNEQLNEAITNDLSPEEIQVIQDEIAEYEIKHQDISAHYFKVQTEFQALKDEYGAIEPAIFNIRSNLIAFKKMTPKEVDAHLNPPVPKEQLIAEVEQKKQSLLAEANNAISPLQDAVDLDMATEEEVAALQEWKKYRVLLNRVDTSTAPNIDWPEKP